MKRFLPLFLLMVMGLSSCTTLSNRRDLFAPQEGDGPYTKALYTGKRPPPQTQEKKETQQPGA